MKTSQPFRPYQKKFSYFFSNLSFPQKLFIFTTLLIISYTLGRFSASPSPSPFPPSTSTSASRKITTLYQTTSTTTPLCPQTENEHNDFGRACTNPVQPNQVRPTILAHLFNNTSPYDNFPPPHMAHLLRPKKVKGWGSTRPVFDNLIREVRPETIIEVGTFLGASAIHMAELTRQIGLDTQILCLDDFRGWAGFRDKFGFVPMQNGDVVLLAQFLQNVITYNSTGSILPIPFSTGSGLEKLCELGIRADLIEVDAGHDFHSAWSDINRAHKLLRPGGVLFGHDYFLAADNRGVRRAVQLFARLKGFKIRVDGQHWILDPS